MKPSQLKEDIIKCLKAGPLGWKATAKTLSPQAVWLVDYIAPGLDPTYTPVAFRQAFPELSSGPDWPELGKMVQECFNVLLAQHHGHKHWQAGNIEAIAAAYPASEIIALSGDSSEWRARWAAAGGETIQGRCVALRLSSVWSDFSDYGQPYEPFEWSATLGREDLDEEEAEELELT
jgi:hypothetical protein